MIVIIIPELFRDIDEKKRRDKEMETVFLSILFFLSTLSKAGVEKITINEVLDKFSQTVANYNSFIHKIDWRSSSTDYQTKEPIVRFGSSEVRYDGNRIKNINSIWGQVGDMYIPKNEPAYNSVLWDGRERYQYSRASRAAKKPSNLAGSVIISHEKRRDFETCGLSFNVGYFTGDTSRIDTRLRQEKSAKLLEEMENVGGSECYVIEADTKYGKYKVWFDPQHGYNIAKAVLERRPGDFDEQFNSVVDPRLWTRREVRNVKFEEVNGVWVPISGEAQSDIKYLHSGGWHKIISSFKITSIQFNPDHEFLKSFSLDDIENGAKVNIFNKTGKGYVPIRYTWQDGKPIPNIDDAVIEQIDKMAEELLAEGKVPPALKAKKEPGTVPATVSDLLDKYAAAQSKLQSFIAKAESKIEYTGKANRTENETCEFRTDGQRVNHRATFWYGVIATKEKPGYKSFLWDGKSLIECKQQSPALGGYRVFIENKDESKKKLIATQYKGAALMGICAGDYERVDSILRKSDTISVLDRTERVGDANCYVIDAATKRGRYKLWLDPQHDYNIAKMEVQRKKGDLVRNTGRVETSMSFVLDGVGFKKVGDVWVSMEADMRQEEDNRAGVVKWHHKRIEMVLNPDHNALHSFVADDIPDGTKVSISGLANTEYTWRNGKPVQE